MTWFKQDPHQPNVLSDLGDVIARIMRITLLEKLVKGDNRLAEIGQKPLLAPMYRKHMKEVRASHKRPRRIYKESLLKITKGKGSTF